MADSTSTSSGSGLWLPHSSSIDFCEENYEITPYIVEFHNTWSSIFIALLPLVGYFKSNPMNEIRFKFAYLILSGHLHN